MSFLYMGFYNWLFGRKVEKLEKKDKQMEVEKKRYNLRSKNKNNEIEKGKLEDYLETEQKTIINENPDKFGIEKNAKKKI
tara:strand:+ start:65 stop:304 length:240 start_codon:yes stop_codon:yes gene_type:complete